MKCTEGVAFRKTIQVPGGQGVGVFGYVTFPSDDFIGDNGKQTYDYNLNGSLCQYRVLVEGKEAFKGTPFSLGKVFY